MTFELKWTMPNLSKQGFVETIDNKSISQGSNYCGWGSYYANLTWVFCIANNIALKDDGENEKEWRKLCDFINVNYDKSKNSKISIACEAVNKISIFVYSEVFYCVNKPWKNSSKRKEIYENILKHLNVEFYDEILNTKNCNPIYCFKYLQSAADTMDNILDNICNGGSAMQIVTEILNAIEQYVSNQSKQKHKLLHDYIDNKRCVAAYVFDQLQNGMRGYIAFSGFTECEDQDVLDKLSDVEQKKIEKNDAFIKELIEISEGLKFILIIINKDVLIYKTPYNVYYGNIVVNSTLGDELASFTKKHKGLYSCSERKIFTAFYPKTPLICLPEEICCKYSVGYYIGKLYIQREPCGECCTGIKYEWENGHVFAVKPQLY